LSSAQALECANAIDTAEPNSNWSAGQYFNPIEGHFTTVYINHMLRQLTTPRAFLHRTSTLCIDRGSTKEHILSMLQTRQDRFILQWNGGSSPHEGPYGHSVCIRQHPTSGTWYLIDSEKARPLPLHDPADWGRLYGMTYALASGNPSDYGECPASLLGEPIDPENFPTPPPLNAWTYLHPDAVQLWPPGADPPSAPTGTDASKPAPAPQPAPAP